MRVGIPAFMLVLLTMPLGHALMVLNEHVLGRDYQLVGAGVLGFLGVFLLVLGIRYNHNRTAATLLGLIAGILIWTGWVEFSFVWIAQKLHVPHYMQNGEVATKAEYLVMPSSIGLLGSFLFFFAFSKTGCTFFKWIQIKSKMQGAITDGDTTKKPFSITTMVEVVMITWAFYLVLLLVYDDAIFGDHHIVTFLVAIGSLVWSVWLFFRLIAIRTFDYAIRYAVPTVIIFWNCVEIIGRWGLMKEIWIEPMAYWPHMLITLAAFLGFVVYYIFTIRKKLIKVPVKK